MAEPEDELAAAEGQGRGGLRASYADREQAIEVLKAAFVQGRLAKDEFDLRVGRGLRGRVDARIPRALAQGFRGRSPSRSRLADLPDHPHLPVRPGHDPMARWGSAG